MGPPGSRHGRAVALAAAIWGVGIIGFGFANSLVLAVIGLVVAGGADMVSGLFRSTMWNQSIPDSLRGRLAGIEMLSYSSGPTLGNVEAGVVESLAGLPRFGRLWRRTVRRRHGCSICSPSPLLELRRRQCEPT